MESSPFIHGFSLVLASQSPRRRDLLRQAGFPFSVRPSEIPEVRNPGESARDYVARLAAEKADAVVREPHEGVLAADTTVAIVHEGIEHILEKPADGEDARRMLQLLSGRPHTVYTAVCLKWGQNSLLHVEGTRVYFAELSAAEIEDYIASGEPFDKAGGYGIQGLASRFVPRIEGCYFNIVGLPVHRVSTMLAQAGLLARGETPSPAS